MPFKQNRSIWKRILREGNFWACPSCGFEVLEADGYEKAIVHLLEHSVAQVPKIEAAVPA